MNGNTHFSIGTKKHLSFGGILFGDIVRLHIEPVKSISCIENSDSTPQRRTLFRIFMYFNAIQSNQSVPICNAFSKYGRSMEEPNQYGQYWKWHGGSDNRNNDGKLKSERENENANEIQKQFSPNFAELRIPRIWMNVQWNSERNSAPAKGMKSYNFVWTVSWPTRYFVYGLSSSCHSAIVRYSLYVPGCVGVSLFLYVCVRTFDRRPQIRSFLQ